jgi:predicted amidohydrolase YtcJ
VPMHPLTAVWVASTRLGADGSTVLAPGERIDRVQALRAVTVDSARVLGVDREIGSLEPGKHADFAVLEEDPFEVPDERLPSMGVWGTVLGGRPLPATRR